jgi:hypothetical protein
MIVQAGALNTTALVVPGLYVVIQPPSALLLNGVPSNRIAAVGTATWGPVNQPVIVSSMQSYAQNFGAIQVRKYDMGTAVAAAVLQGASDFRCVRVTDGTDIAAVAYVGGTTPTVSSCGMVLTARYTGSLGNSLTWQIAKGSTVNTFKVIIGIPGYNAEAFDNIPGTGSTFWTNAVAAINAGNSPSRGPSQFVVAAIGTGANATAAPAVTTAPQATFTTGTDGTTTITAAVLVGSDSTATALGTGMYALRQQGCSIGMLADADDSTQWTNQVAFGLSEGVYMMMVTPAGSPVQNGSTGTVDLLTSAAISSYAGKVLHGDWIWWNDTVNQVTRLISPQGFAAGLYGNMSPQRSGLNKQLYGVVGTQKTGLPGSGIATAYSNAQLTALITAGADVIGAPAPGGNYFSLLVGHNTSGNAAVNGDNYTRLTNYISATLNAGMGQYVGRVINASLLQQIRATQLAFLQAMLSQGLLGSVTGALPFSVICDASNNPLSRTALGYVQSDAAINYQGINEKFIVNLQGGVTVQIASAVANPAGQTAG